MSLVAVDESQSLVDCVNYFFFYVFGLLRSFSLLNYFIHLEDWYTLGFKIWDFWLLRKGI